MTSCFDVMGQNQSDDVIFGRVRQVHGGTSRRPPACTGTKSAILDCREGGLLMAEPELAYYECLE